MSFEDWSDDDQENKVDLRLWRKLLQYTLHYRRTAILFTIGVLLDPAGNMGTLWVPAHYHGVIVGGVTIALMGALYHLSERAGWPPVSRALATWQPVIFGIGVATMIAGLAWAGAEGAVRKDWVHGIVVSPQFRTGLNLMGFGAVIAVLGGIMFVVHTLYSLTRPRRLR